MRCDDADLFMMKYMDGDISTDEALQLNEHISCCELCHDSFYIYDSMLTDFSKLPEFKAPVEFETQVMAKIVQLSENEFEVRYSMRDKINGVVWGTFTVLFGSGAILAFYRDPILNSLSQNPYIGGWISKLIPIANHVAEQTEAIKVVTEKTFEYAGNSLSNYMGVILTILTAVCALQFYILHKKKKYDKADGQ